MEDNEKPRKLDTGLIIGIGAVVISILTLFVYIYQARIMQKQQYTSVWPYVEWYTGNVDEVYIEVKNKGIGPAIIKGSSWVVDGKRFKGVRDFLVELLGKEITGTKLITSYIDGRVMSPGESFRPFTLSDSLYGPKLSKAWQEREVVLEICFCSVYGECWKTTGQQVTEATCE